MNTADLALILMAAVSLASIGRDWHLQTKVADRLRLVNPVREPKQDADKAAVVEPIATVRRTGHG